MARRVPGIVHFQLFTSSVKFAISRILGQLWRSSFDGVGSSVVATCYCGLPHSTHGKEILMRLHEKGIAVPSDTTLNDQYCLRIAIANHRSVQTDFDWLAREVMRLGKEIS